MYKGDRSRKETLVEYGFRLPSALDNRPLRFDEFEAKSPQRIYVSATPSVYEKQHCDVFVEQVVRPTGLLDPAVEIRPALTQVDDFLSEIRTLNNFSLIYYFFRYPIAFTFEKLEAYICGVLNKVNAFNSLLSQYFSSPLFFIFTDPSVNIPFSL